MKPNYLKLWGMLGIFLVMISLSSCKDDEAFDGPENPPVTPEIPTTPPVRLAVNTKYQNHLKIEMDTDSVYTLTGINGDGDPYMKLEPLEEDAAEECCVFEFEYQLAENIGNLEIFFLDDKGGVSPARSASFGEVKASQDWAKFSVRLKKLRKEFEWGKKDESLRIDVGDNDRTNMKMRNLKLRVMNAEELKEEEEEDNIEKDKLAYEQSVKDYLAKDYICKVTTVAVGKDKITVSGNYVGDGIFFLAEIPTYVDLFKIKKVDEAYKIPLSQANFTQVVNRIREVDGYKYDGLLSRWAIFKEGTEKDELVSHARCADVDDITPLRTIDPIAPKGKKGLGGIVPDSNLESDIRDLGIGSATINICPVLFMHEQNAGDDIEHVYNGKTYYFSRSFVEANLDAPLRIAAKYQVAVGGILLINPVNSAGGNDKIASIFQHPDYNTKGTYAMPNMTNVESTDYYAAALDFLAERYSNKEMRIAHWIIHNEVDGAVNWVNMGDVQLATFMETYMHSVRMCYNIVHQYDQHARVYIPFTHGWNNAAGGGWYKVIDILDMLKQYSAAEGDFFWAPACHSYSEQLNNPCVWNDKNATFSMNTQYVSLKNLEVLDKWITTPSNQYQGKYMRKAWLSEAGTGTPVAMQEGDIEKQAAGFAYGWKKIKALESIEGIQWHNWYDNPAEGVLLGLRFQNGTGLPESGQPKPVWHTFQKAGTAEEDAYFEKYLSVIGIPDWNILQTVTD